MFLITKLMDAHREKTTGFQLTTPHTCAPLVQSSGGAASQSKGDRCCQFASFPLSWPRPINCGGSDFRSHDLPSWSPVAPICQDFDLLSP